MKHILKIFALILVFSTLCMPVIASSYVEGRYFITDDIEIEIEDACSDVVANKIFNDMIPNISSKSIMYSTQSSILCIFGHSLDTGSIIRTYHNVNTSQPKCREEIWLYEVCTRSTCDYSNYDLICVSHLYGCH